MLAREREFDFCLATDEAHRAHRAHCFEAALRCGSTFHGPCRDGFGDAFDLPKAEAAQREEIAEQFARRSGNDNCSRLGKALEPGCNVRRIADHGLLFRRGSADEVAHHHKPGRDRDPDLNPFGARFERLYCSDHVEPGSHGALGVILVRARIAEIGQHSITHEPGDAAVVTGNNLRAGGSIGADHFPHVLRIKARREFGRAHQIAEHHGKVAPLGIVPMSLGIGQFGLLEFGDSAQYLAPMAEKDSEPVEVLVRQFGKDIEIDSVLGKTQRVLPEPQLLQPVRNLLHWLHRRSVGGVRNWTSASQMLCQFFPNGTGRLLQQFFCGFGIPNRRAAQPC
jgi:hypothetical protein